jgi:hypothetical protein
MNKLLLVLAGAVAAAGIYYISRTPYPPKNEQVQGAIGGRRLAQGATVCVNKIQNLSGKQLAMEGIDEDLVAQLNKAGFKATAATTTGCDGSVHGEIIVLKGKDRVEAEVEFRLMISGEQTPYLSSIGKGKSGELAAALNTGVAMAIAPSKPKQADPAVASREALVAAFADVARQIEQQRPSRSTRAAVQ